MAEFSRIVKSVIFFGITLYLLRKREHHQCGRHSQTYLSLILSILICRSLVIVRAPHTTSTCLMVYGVWHVKHCGGCFCWSIKEWLRLVWLVCNRDIMTCSFLDFRKAGLHSPKVGFIWKSFLLILFFQHCCHFVRNNLLIWGFKSVYRIEILSGIRSKADLTAESALSFPLTPMWLGIQHIIISLWLDIESSLLSSLTINGFCRFLFPSDVNTESKSEIW